MKTAILMTAFMLSTSAQTQANSKAAIQGPSPGTLVPRGDLGGVDCPQPLEAKSPRPKGKMPAPGAHWKIHAQGVGDLWIGESLPLSVIKREGTDPTQDFMKKVESLDSNALLNQGLVNQAGYPVIRLKSLEISLSFAQEWRVLSIETGPSLHTSEGTGEGSSLAELKRAHKGFKLHQGPEPHHCVATVPNVRFLGFRFSDCTAACRGERSQRVTVGKANYDFMEQRWRQQPSRPPIPKRKKPTPKK